MKSKTSESLLASESKAGVWKDGAGEHKQKQLKKGEDRPRGANLEEPLFQPRGTIVSCPVFDPLLMTPKGMRLRVLKAEAAVMKSR